MNWKLSNRAKTNLIILFSLCIAGLWILLIYAKTGIVFETNDDRYISEILSGTLTGRPDAHATHVNYLLCLPLTLLYRIHGNIAWYGWMLVLTQVLCYTLIGYLLYKKLGITSLPFYLGILCSVLYMTGLIQYTSTASLIAITGYVCYLFIENRKKRIGSFFLLELLAFFLRKQAMLMIQPLGMLTVLGVLFTKQLPLSREKFRKYAGECLSLIIPLLLALSIGLLGNAIGYHEAEWQEYLRFNKTREAMFDYYGTPSYDSAKNILDRYGVSEAQYLAFCNFTILEENLSTDCLYELADLAKEQYAAHRGTSDLVHLKNSVLSSITGYVHDDYWQINRIAIVLWALLFVCILCYRKFLYLLPSIGLWIGRTITLTYLLFRGRVLARVVVPMYVCEIILLVSVLVCVLGESFDVNASVITGNSSTKKASTTIWAKVALIFCCCILLLPVSAYSAKIQYSYVKEQNQSQLIFVESFPQLQDYCLSHPENRYLIEAQSLGYYRGSALSPMIYQPRNSLVTGCWCSPSPHMKEVWSTYLAGCQKSSAQSGSKPLYFIVADGQEERVAPILTYLSEYTGHAGTLSDQFTVSHGGTYLVYCYQ